MPVNGFCAGGRPVRRSNFASNDKPEIPLTLASMGHIAGAPRLLTKSQSRARFEHLGPGLSLPCNGTDHTTAKVCVPQSRKLYCVPFCYWEGSGDYDPGQDFRTFLILKCCPFMCTTQAIINKVLRSCQNELRIPNALRFFPHIRIQHLTVGCKTAVSVNNARDRKQIR